MNLHQAKLRLLVVCCVTEMRSSVLVHAQGLHRTFGKGESSVKALDDVSFFVGSGETVVIVGESGSGKTTAARVVLGLETPDSGSVVITGQETSALSERQWHQLRRSIQVVLQDPMSQLNRRHSVERIVSAPLRAFGIGDRAHRRRKVLDLLESVGLDERYLERKPHEMSGGQCQRVAIARALAVEPKIVVLDESVSALDVSVRAQVLNLLKQLQSDLGLSYLLITHDLAVARYMGHRVYVMFSGRIVEFGEMGDVLTNPQHPYTRNLLHSTPSGSLSLDRRHLGEELTRALPGPDPDDQCRYLSRCEASHSRELCRNHRPELVAVGPNHRAACHFPLAIQTTAGVHVTEQSSDSIEKEGTP